MIANTKYFDHYRRDFAVLQQTKVLQGKAENAFKLHVIVLKNDSIAMH